MSLANIQGKLSRTEMKKIMTGSGTGGSCLHPQGYPNLCYCSTGEGQCNW